MRLLVDSGVAEAVLKVLTIQSSDWRRHFSTLLIFKFRRVAHLGGLFTAVLEGSVDVFLQAAIIPHLEQRCVLFWCPSNALFLRPQRCLTYLRICSSLVTDCNLC